jgi:hypothetical protein
MSALHPTGHPSSSAATPSQARRATYLALAVVVGLLLGMALLSIYQRTQVRATVAPPALQSWLLVAGQDYPTQGNAMALADGTRLAIKVQSAFDGRLTLQSLGSDGRRQGTSLWVADLRAGQALVSPSMHLTGTRGEEVMALELRASNGETLRSEVRFWHV